MLIKTPSTLLIIHNTIPLQPNLPLPLLLRRKVLNGITIHTTNVMTQSDNTGDIILDYHLPEMFQTVMLWALCSYY